MAVSRRRLLATCAAMPVLVAACQALPSVLSFPTPTPAAPRALRVGWPSTYTGYDAVLHNVGNHLAPERHVRLENAPVDVGMPPFPEVPARYAAAVKVLTTATTPDLLMTDSSLLPPLARAGVLRDLGPLLRDQDWFKPADFYGNGVQAGQFRGKQVALPISTTVEVLLYNRQAFQARGIAFPRNDWTWDQLAAVAKALTSAPPSGGSGRWGFSILPGLPSLWTMAWQRGARVLSDDGAQIDLGEPGTLQAMGFLADLIQTQKVAPRRDPASLGNVNQASADELRDLQAGAIAMAAAFSGGSTWWRSAGNPDVAVTELPRADRKVWVGFATMLSIPANAPDPPHSLNGLRALLDASAVRIHLPARKGADDLRKINDLLMESEASALSDALGGVRYLPSEFPGDAILPLLWTDYFTPILTGQKDPARAAKDAQPVIQEQLTRLRA